MTNNELWHLLAPLYGDGEAKAIARLVYEVQFGLSFSDICLGKDTQLSANSQEELKGIAERLLQHEPVQYVLGQAAFCGRTFTVNRHVLIPRPETEELCSWIGSQGDKSSENATNILDIGTGSGCIAITLAAEIPKAQVTAWDISTEALRVAEENAKRNHVHVSFEQVDALHIPTNIFCKTTKYFDFIVSNPPYICNNERAHMESNVLNYEPHSALFVPDDDALLFYRAIAQYGKTALKEGGWLYFEINPLYANILTEMLDMMAYHHIEIKEDQFGKQRMIRARRATP
jgi:release factor glutamine methyltransferase